MEELEELKKRLEEERPMVWSSCHIRSASAPDTAVRRFVYPARWNIESSISNTSRSSSTSSIL